MALLVQKFGGTSVGSIERIEAVADRVIAAHRQGHQVVVVVSAMAGETNRLLGLAKAITEIPSARELDVLLSAGEQVSMSLLAMAIENRGVPAASLTGDQVRILTDATHTNARILSVETEKLTQLLQSGKIVVVAGFQGRDHCNDITTLGRGGSDTTAVAIAEALSADECQIFTDVDGVYSTDPRLVNDAQRLNVVHFKHMIEMARCGAKVLQLQSVEYAQHHGVPLRVLSSFDDGEGTLVNFDEQASCAVVGIALQCQQSLLTVSLSKDILLQQLAQYELTAWDVIENSKGLQFIVNCDALPHFRLALGESILSVEAVAIVSLIGDEIDCYLGDIRHILLQNNIQSHHEKRKTHCFSVLINEKDHQKVTELLHKRFVVSEQSFETSSFRAVS